MPLWITVRASTRGKRKTPTEFMCGSLCLANGVTDCPSIAGPSSGRVGAHDATLNLDHLEPPVGVHDEQVGFPFARTPSAVGRQPGYLRNDCVGRPESMA